MASTRGADGANSENVEVGLWEALVLVALPEGPSCVSQSSHGCWEP